jgi:hypothetical protein
MLVSLNEFEGGWEDLVLNILSCKMSWMIVKLNLHPTTPPLKDSLTTDLGRGENLGLIDRRRYKVFFFCGGS